MYVRNRMPTLLLESYVTIPISGNCYIHIMYLMPINLTNVKFELEILFFFKLKATTVK